MTMNQHEQSERYKMKTSLNQHEQNQQYKMKNFTKYNHSMHSRSATKRKKLEKHNKYKHANKKINKYT